MKTYIKYRLNVGKDNLAIYRIKGVDTIEIDLYSYTYEEAIKLKLLYYGLDTAYEDAINYLYNDDNWEEVTNDIDYEVLKSLAYNDYTTTETLDMLSFNEDPFIRNGVAYNKNTPVKRLDKLSKDEWYSIRKEVANNRNTPIEILKELINDKSYSVRCAVEENPKYINK